MGSGTGSDRRCGRGVLPAGTPKHVDRGDRWRPLHRRFQGHQPACHPQRPPGGGAGRAVRRWQGQGPGPVTPCGAHAPAGRRRCHGRGDGRAREPLRRARPHRCGSLRRGGGGDGGGLGGARRHRPAVAGLLEPGPVRELRREGRPLCRRGRAPCTNGCALSSDTLDPPASAVHPVATTLRHGNTFRLMAATSTALIGMGLVMVLSASSVEAFKTYGSSFLFFRKQLVGAALGLVAVLGLSRLDYRRLRKLARPLFWLTLVGLVAALIPGIGVSGGGSSRWLTFGPVTVQPSELAKLALILVAAHVLERKGGFVGDIRELCIPVIPMTALACLLMIAQPDLGTTIITMAAVLTVLYLAGARMRHLGALVSVGSVAAAGL